MTDDILLAIGNIDEYNIQNVPISKERIEKSKKLKFEEDKKRCLLAEVLLRKALIQYGLDVNNIALSFKYNEYNKPFLKDFKNIFFNISHSGKYVVCAVSNSEIGLDIEEVKEPNLKVAKKFFTEQEYKNIKNSSDFYRYWVLKESYIKFLGKGLYKPLNSFNVDDENLGVNFLEIDFVLGYKCAICSKYKKSYYII